MERYYGGQKAVTAFWWFWEKRLFLFLSTPDCHHGIIVHYEYKMITIFMRYHLLGSVGCQNIFFGWLCCSYCLLIWHGKSSNWTLNPLCVTIRAPEGDDWNATWSRKCVDLRKLEARSSRQQNMSLETVSPMSNQKAVSDIVSDTAFWFDMGHRHVWCIKHSYCLLKWHGR
jgi:hypothetical protein